MAARKQKTRPSGVAPGRVRKCYHLTADTGRRVAVAAANATTDESASQVAIKEIWRQAIDHSENSRRSSWTWPSAASCSSSLMGFSFATLVSGSAIEAIELTALIEMESEMLVFVGKLKELEMPSQFSFAFHKGSQQNLYGLVRMARGLR